MRRLRFAPLLGAFSFVAIALFAVRGGAAGDGSAASPPPAAAAAAPAAGKVPGHDVPWKELTPEQKGEYMKAEVLPKMKPIFQAFDAKEFKKFDCMSCHGKDAKAKKFKMPNTHILKLPGTPEGFQALLKKKPDLGRWAKFMGEEVKPQMAALLGMPSFDPTKPEAGGFSCAGCHVIQKPK